MKPADFSLPSVPGSIPDIVPMGGTKFFAAFLLVSCLVYLIALAVYRLYLSPVAKFPGPKLAALTQWYEIYYDVFKNGGGQFTFEIRRMHEKYGEWVISLPVFCRRRV
jgi:hypothetical protein